MISKAVALLDTIITTIIHNQTGFIKGRHSSSNLRRFFNLINISQHKQIQYQFPQISDYTINWTKSTILLAVAQVPYLLISRGDIKNLSVFISPQLSEMVQLSFTPILTKMRIDLKSCNYLALSLRWIATVKIKILPQINSLFSMIPFKPTSKWFQSLKCDFYWKNTKARISLSTLYVINVINVC